MAKKKRADAANTYTEDEYIAFIKSCVPKPENCKHLRIHRITNSYWRINLWGTPENKRVEKDGMESLMPNSPLYIIDSKFIRIDIDSNGEMRYNDVTKGKEL